MAEIERLEERVANLDQDVRDSRVNIHGLRDQLTEVLSRSYLQTAEINQKILKLESAMKQEQMNNRWIVLLLTLSFCGLIAMFLTRR